MADWLYQIIPDFASICLGVLALLYRWYLAYTGAMQWPDFGWAIVTGLGLAGFLGLLWFLTRGRGMGLGDVKFALVMGILVGWPRGLIAMFSAFVLGAVWGSLMIGLHLKSLKERIAFGPFLVLGTGLALIWGNQIWQIYSQLLGR